MAELGSLVNPFGRIYVGDDAPDRAPAKVGDLWVDTVNSLLKRCTSISPYTWTSVEAGGGGAPTDATYITQTANGTLTQEQALALLATGIVKNTTTTGVLSIATEGTDYYGPGGTDIAITDGGTGQSSATAGFDALAPTTTQGDTIYHNGTDNVRLAKGTAGQAYLMNSGATAPEWGMAASVSYFFSNGLGAGFAPTDNTNHYLAAAGNPSNTASTTAGVAAPLMKRAGTITDVYLMVIVGGTNGSAETGSAGIWINNTTDSVVFNNTIAWNGGATPASYTSTGLSIALAAGDFWQFKVDPPTWTTNPTAVFYLAQVVITFP